MPVDIEALELPVEPVAGPRVDTWDPRDAASLPAARPTRLPVLVAVAIVVLGLLLLAINAKLPVVSNSLIYSAIADRVVKLGYNPLPVSADVNLSYGKPIGFPLLCVPFIAAFGTNVGIKLASFFGTAFFVWAAYLFFARMNRRVGLDARALPLELLILFVNPLVAYQFWSGYSDGLFAGEVLLAFILTDDIATATERANRGRIALLGIVIYLAVLTKLYGLILGVACPVYLMLHWRKLLVSTVAARSRLAWLTGVFGALGVAVVFARLGLNPTLGVIAGGQGQSAGFEELSRGLANPSSGLAMTVGTALLFAVVFNFHLTLPALFRRGGRRGWPLGPTVFAAVFVVGLAPFGDEMAYNMRYLIPAFPFLVVAIASAQQGMRQGFWQHGLRVAFALVATAATANYNLPAVYQALRPMNDRIDQVLVRERTIENLRMPEHLELQQCIALINRNVEPNGSFFWSSDYYGAATRGVIGRIGVRPDIEVLYAYTPQHVHTPPYADSVLVVRFYSRDWVTRLETRFDVADLGDGVYRVRDRVRLDRPGRDLVVRAGEAVDLAVTASPPGDESVVAVEFVVDGTVVATATEAPYAATWSATEPGRHVASALVYLSRGVKVDSNTSTFFVGRLAVERLIVRPADDAEEDLATGRVELNSTDLELVEDRDRGPQLVGLRFADLPIPEGARIAAAHLQFTQFGSEAGSDAASLAIRVEAAGMPATFVRRPLDLSRRRRAPATVEWQPGRWDHLDARSSRQRTPDLAALAQAVIDGPDWRPGNAIVFLIEGAGTRVARAADGVEHEADLPALYVELEEVVAEPEAR